MSTWETRAGVQGGASGQGPVGKADTLSQSIMYLTHDLNSPWCVPTLHAPRTLQISAKSAQQFCHISSISSFRVRKLKHGVCVVCLRSDHLISGAAREENPAVWLQSLEINVKRGPGAMLLRGSGDIERWTPLLTAAWTHGAATWKKPLWVTGGSDTASPPSLPPHASKKDKGGRE